MLATPTFIFTPINSLGSGLYEFDIFMSPSSQTKFLNLGDVVEDAVGNQYEIVAPTAIPASDADTMTVLFLTTDIAPALDSGFDSSTFTPGQNDLSPFLRTAGTIIIVLELLNLFK